MRRQDLAPAYAVSGSIYVLDSRRSAARREQGSGATQFPDEKVGAGLVDGIHAMDIDTELDFRFAESLAVDDRAKAK